MPQAFHFGLAGVGERAFVQQLADTNQVFFLVGALDLVFQFIADVEVVLERALAAAGNDGNFGQASVQCFFNPVLDQWLVHHRQHFLGHRLGCREEARAVTSSREQAFLDHKCP
ncbi:hypothetical protein D3C80_1441930 [compost metagenome]